jgi:hypothetical protein
MADILSIPIGTVKSRLHMAVASRLRCVEVVEMEGVRTKGARGFPADRVDFSRILALPDIFSDFSTTSGLPRGYLAV